MAIEIWKLSSVNISKHYAGVSVRLYSLKHMKPKLWASKQQCPNVDGGTLALSAIKPAGQAASKNPSKSKQNILCNCLNHFLWYYLYWKISCDV